MLAEATALVERVEFTTPSFAEPMILGVRRDGCLSIYLSADEAYHFNTRHELRRAYLDGRLLKAEQHRLVALTRNRTATEVQLVRHEFTDAEMQQLLSRLQQSIDLLRKSIEQAAVQRCVPDDLPARERTAQWLAPLSAVQVAAEPHAR